MRRISIVIGSLALLAVGCVCGGCDDRRPASSDGGAGGADAAGGGTVDTATWSVTGAQTGSFDFDGDANYISCVTDGSGFFSVSAASFAGGGDSFQFNFRGYTGPGSYAVQYRGASDDPTGDVDLVGGYRYWIFYNQSTVDFSVQVPTMCNLVVSEVSGDPSRVSLALTCSDMVATITSPDYDDMDGAGLRPHVNLSAQVVCEL